MRIAILNQSYPPMISGAALFSCHLAEALAERGHKILVLAASDQGKAYRQERGNLTILRLQSYPNPYRVGQHFLLWPVKEIHAALKDFTPEVIHLHEPFQMAYFARLYARQAGVPTILTIHALPSLISVQAIDKPDLKKTIEKGLWKYADFISRQFDVEVTPTETISKIVAERIGVRPLVVSGGVNLQIFRPTAPRSQLAACLREELGIDGGARIILHVGRLDAGKNVGMIIRAVGLTIQTLPERDIHLLVVGDGCEKKRLEKLAQDMGIAGKCHFPGFITDPDRLATIYCMADLFCMASEIETQGLVLLEAAACGLPCVAVNATAIPEIIHDGVNGLLVPTGDIRRMAEGITTILQDNGLSKKMRLACRKSSFEHDFNRTVDAYESIFWSAIQERATAKNGKEVLPKGVVVR